MYHTFAEAIASILCDMPYKLTNAVLLTEHWTNLTTKEAGLLVPYAKLLRTQTTHEPGRRGPQRSLPKRV